MDSDKSMSSGEYWKTIHEAVAPGSSDRPVGAYRAFEPDGDRTNADTRDVLGEKELYQQTVRMNSDLSDMILDHTLNDRNGQTNGLTPINEIDLRSWDEKKGDIVAQFTTELAERELPVEIKSVVMLIQGRDVGGWDERNKSDLIHYADRALGSDEPVSVDISFQDYYEEKISRLRDDLVVLGYFFENAKDGMPPEDRFGYADYEVNLRELYHLAVVIDGADLGNPKTNRELRQRLEEVRSRLNHIYFDQLTDPLTDVEKFNIENRMHLNERGILVQDEESDSTHYAWERDGASYYEVVRVTSRNTNHRFNVLFYGVPDINGMNLCFEAVNADGSRMDIESNETLTVDLNQDVIPEEIHDNITHIVERARAGFTYAIEDEGGNLLSKTLNLEDPPFYKLNPETHRVEESYTWNFNRAEIPLSNPADFPRRNIIEKPETSPNLDEDGYPIRWFYKYSRRYATDANGVSPVDEYVCYEQDPKNGKILRYSVDEDRNKLSSAPEGEISQSGLAPPVDYENIPVNLLKEYDTNQEIPDRYLLPNVKAHMESKIIQRMNLWSLKQGKYSNIERIDLPMQKNYKESSAEADIIGGFFNRIKNA